MIILTSHLCVSTVASNLPPITPSTSMKRLMALCLMHAVIAPRDFNSPWSLKNMSIHTHQDLILCTNCPQKFTTNWGMKLHAKLHQGYIFQCNHCKYNSTSQTNLDQHVWGLHGDKFPTLCGEVYSWRHQVTTYQEKCVKCINITTEEEKAHKKLAKKVDRKHKH